MGMITEARVHSIAPCVDTIEDNPPHQINAKRACVSVPYLDGYLFVYYTMKTPYRSEQVVRDQVFKPCISEAGYRNILKKIEQFAERDGIRL